MADINWSPSSDLSSFYMGRMAPPIKLPDGTYIPTPNVLSVDQIYQGILPPSVPSTLPSQSGSMSAPDRQVASKSRNQGLSGAKRSSAATGETRTNTRSAALIMP